MKYSGATYSPNMRRIYTVPHSGWILEAYESTATSFSSVLSKTIGSRGVLFKWFGSCYAPNTGKLYTAPYSSPSVLVFNPVNDDVGFIPGVRGFNKYHGCAYAPNTAKIYMALHDYNGIFVVDPLTNATSVLNVPARGSKKWAGITYAPNVNKLLAAPYAANAILLINPVDNATDASTLTVSSNTTYKWRSIVYVEQTGLCYAAPYSAAAVLVVNPVSNTTSYIAIASYPGNNGGRLWLGLAYSPLTQTIVCAPSNAVSALVIDPMRNMTSHLSLPMTTANLTSKWSGMVYYPPTGDLVAVPSNMGTQVLIFNVSVTAAFRAPTAHPTAAPTSAPTTCGSLIDRAWPVDAGGVVSIYPVLGVSCTPYSELSIPTTARVPSSTWTLRFPGPGLTDPLTPGRFAELTRDLTVPITLDLSNHALVSLPPSVFAAFAGRVGRLDLSGGPLASVDANALAALTALHTLVMTRNPQLLSLPDGWLTGLSRLQSIDVSECGLATITGGTFRGAPALSLIDLRRNPIASIAHTAFANLSALPASGLVLGNELTLQCVARPELNGSGPELTCNSCATDNTNALTVFLNDSARQYCAAAFATGLNNATQYIPSFGATIEYLRWGDRTRFALGRTYHIMPGGTAA
eukprot:m.342099 g.342099  ORF g.342099 m.342099 type:complete len:634 (-) comp16545_c0_seq67:3109-5010(-)